MPRGKSKRSAPSAEEALAWLERHGRQKSLEDLKRYGITVSKAFGVTVGETKKYARQFEKDHELAEQLWASGWYEARLLAAFVDAPEQVGVRQMNRWAADFDNWAIVDTVCFHLFDRTAHAWGRIPVWSQRKPEFTRRAAFALLWSLSNHDKTASDGAFLGCLPLIEEGALDDRNFVKKAVNMALRAIGKRNVRLNEAAVATAERLAQSGAAAPRWIGKHALRELTSAAVRRRL